MKSHRKLTTSLLVAAGAGTAAYAQSTDIPIRYFRPLNNTVSVGVRLTQSSSKVGFHNLGSIARGTYDVSQQLTTSGQSRTYDNGTVSADQKVGDVATNASGTSAIDTNSIYVYDNRRTVDGTGDGKGFYDTSRRNPVANGKMAVTVLDYKKQVDSNGVPLTETVTNSDGTTTTKTLYVKDSNGNYVTEELIAGYYVPHYGDVSGASPYTRYWTGTQGASASTVTNADGTTTTTYTPGTQYYYDSSGAIAGVNMDIYGVASTGASKDADMASGTGFELSFERVIRRHSVRFEWGFKGTLGVSGINGKTEGDVTGDLITLRQTYLTAPGYGPLVNDYLAYDLTQSRPLGQLPATYNSYATSTDANGNTVKTLVPNYISNELTIPLLLTPIATSDGTSTTVIRQAGAASVKGFWQVKGAYYFVRVGPSARFYFSPRFSVSASAGLGVAYYSSRFNIDEKLITTLTSRDVAFRTSELTAANGRDPYDNSKKGVSFGPSMELNAELWMTARTGIYIGAAYEKLGTFSHKIGEQEARVEMGTGTTIRFGINTRF